MEIEDYKTATSEELSARGPQEEKLTQAVVGGLVELDSTQDGSATVLDLDLKRDLKGFGALFESGVADPNNPNVGRYVYRRQMELGGRRIMFLERLGELDQVDAGFRDALRRAQKGDFSNLASDLEAYGLPRQFDVSAAVYWSSRPSISMEKAVGVTTDLLSKHHVGLLRCFYPDSPYPPRSIYEGDLRATLNSLALLSASADTDSVKSWGDLSSVIQPVSSSGYDFVDSDRAMLLWSWSGAGNLDIPLEVVAERLRYSLDDVVRRQQFVGDNSLLDTLHLEAEIIREAFMGCSPTEGLLNKLNSDIPEIFFARADRSPITKLVTGGLMQRNIDLEQAELIIDNHPIFNKMREESFDADPRSSLYTQIAMAATSSVKNEELEEFIKRHQDKKYFDTRLVAGAWIARTDTLLEQIMDFYTSTPRGKKGDDNLLSAAMAHRFANNLKLDVNDLADAYRVISGPEDFSLRNPTMGWSRFFTECYYRRLKKLLQDREAMEKYLRPGQTLKTTDDAPRKYRNDIQSSIVLPTFISGDLSPLFHWPSPEESALNHPKRGRDDYELLTSLPNPIYKPQ